VESQEQPELKTMRRKQPQWRDPENRILAVFWHLCSDVLHDAEELKANVRKIKDLFIQRDFVSIFTDESNYATYLARWVPPRALCYYELLRNTMAGRLRNRIGRDSRICCLGAGPGSELISIAAVAKELMMENSNSGQGGEHTLALDLIDLGDFAGCTAHISSILEQQWGIGINMAGGPSGGTRSGAVDSPTTQIDVDFCQGDLIQPSSMVLEKVAKADMITLFFTLNELFEQNLKGTLAALDSIISQMRPGCLLLVADTFSDMSEIELNGHKFRITLLLDKHFQTSLKTLHSDDSRWYRLKTTLTYPVDLQNVHYFLRVLEKQ